MGYRLVQRKSEYGNRKVWTLKHSESGYYKEVAMGERAEFTNKPQAQKYLNQVRKSLRKPIR